MPWQITTTHTGLSTAADSHIKTGTPILFQSAPSFIKSHSISVSLGCVRCWSGLISSDPGKSRAICTRFAGYCSYSAVVLHGFQYCGNCLPPYLRGNLHGTHSRERNPIAFIQSRCLAQQCPLLGMNLQESMNFKHLFNREIPKENYNNIL